MPHADTTDVQNVTVAFEKDSGTTSTIITWCEFIAGSDAQGCKVVLTFGESDYRTVNLTRGKGCSMQKLIGVDTKALTQVAGFDIEADGSVGTLPIRGEVVADAKNLPCLLTMGGLTPTQSISKFCYSLFHPVLGRF